MQLNGKRTLPRRFPEIVILQREDATGTRRVLSRSEQERKKKEKKKPSCDVQNALFTSRTFVMVGKAVRRLSIGGQRELARETARRGNCYAESIVLLQGGARRLCAR